MEYASVLERRAAKLKSRLHDDLRKQMKKQRAGREAKLTKMMEPRQHQKKEEAGRVQHCRMGS